MNFNTIIYESVNKIGIIKLNRPDRMNAVIEEMYHDIQKALQKASDDPDIRVIILTGTTREKDGMTKQAFCAGADLKKHSTGERTADDRRKYIQLAHDTCQMLYECQKPVIAVINGPSRGAGSEMALCCDFIFIADKASIGFPETGLGTCVGGGVTKHLTAITGVTIAKELLFTGKVLDGNAAVDYGIALSSHPIDTLYQEAEQFASVLAEKAPVSISLVKKLIHSATVSDVKHVLANETEAILACMKTEDWREGILAFSENRKPDYKGR